MADCENTIPSASEDTHDIEHGDHHMDGELYEMGVGDKDDAPLSQAEIIAALRGE